LAPPGPKTSLKKKLKSFVGIIETFILFGMVMGGIFFGIFTPTEAAALGAFFTLVMALIRKQLSWEGFVTSLADTIRISCMIIVLVAGAIIFGHSMAVTRVPFEISAWVGNLPLPS
jgi:TRAP-type C4-dicarboxylate transport system permease large subunit